MDVEIKPRPPAEQFSDLLVLYRKQCRDLRGAPLSQARLAELLESEAGVIGYDGRRISRWERGLDLIRQDNRELLVGFVLVFHRCMGMADRATADKFLTTGQYSPLTESEAYRINPDWVVQALPPKTEPPPLQPKPKDIFITPQQIMEFIYARLPNPHLRTPRGVVIWLLDSLKHVPWLAIVLPLVLAFLAYNLLTPALRWPIPEVWGQVEAYASFALAHLLIPVAVAIFITPDDYEKFEPQDGREQKILFLLKWMGAVVGFGMVALALWLMGLAIYYTGWSKLVGVLDGAAAVGPLFMAYVAGGRIPTDRYKLFNGKLRIHPTDTFFGLLFLIAPWVLMGMVLVAHDQFATPAFGGVVAVLLGGIVIWHSSTLTKGQQFWIIGVACPLLCFWLLRQEFYPIYPPPLTQLLLGVLAWVYVQSFFVYWIALCLWRPRKWGWRQWGRTTAEFVLIIIGMSLTIVQTERGTPIVALAAFVAVLATVIISVWKSGKAQLDLSNPANES